MILISCFNRLFGLRGGFLACKKILVLFRLFLGLVNGTVYEYAVAEDKNSLSEQRHWTAHTSIVTSVLYSSEAELIFSCSKDKTAIWHCSETSVKMG